MAWNILGLGLPIVWRRFVSGGPSPTVYPIDVCVDAVRTRFVYLAASTDHARQCDGGSMAATSALRQSVTAAPTPSGGDPVKQLWEFTLDSAWVPIGGIASWTIKVGFAASNDTAATKTYTATITEPGQSGTVDAKWTIELDTSDLTGATFGDVWWWTCWRTDTGNREELGAGNLNLAHCVTVA